MQELVIFVMRGKTRKDVMLKLEKPKNPNSLAKEIGTHLTTISRTLKTLAEKGLVKCLNPQDANFKLYTLTELGKFVLEEVKKIL